MTAERHGRYFALRGPPETPGICGCDNTYGEAENQCDKYYAIAESECGGPSGIGAMLANAVYRIGDPPASNPASSNSTGRRGLGVLPNEGEDFDVDAEEGSWNVRVAAAVTEWMRLTQAEVLSAQPHQQPQQQPQQRPNAGSKRRGLADEPEEKFCACGAGAGLYVRTRNE